VGRPLRGLYTLFVRDHLLWPSCRSGGPLDLGSWYLCWFLWDRVEEVEEALGEGGVGEDDVVDCRVGHVCGHG